MDKSILKSISRPILFYLAIGLVTVLYTLAGDLREWKCDHVTNGQSWSEGFSGSFFKPNDNCKRVSFTKETISSYPLLLVLWPVSFIDTDNLIN